MTIDGAYEDPADWPERDEWLQCCPIDTWPAECTCPDGCECVCPGCQFCGWDDDE